jgi:hypothetical protein
MYSLLNLKMNVKNTLLSLRLHFHLDLDTHTSFTSVRFCCPALQGALSGRCICSREGNIPHVSTVNASNFCCPRVTPVGFILDPSVSSWITKSSFVLWWLVLRWRNKFKETGHMSVGSLLQRRLVGSKNYEIFSKKSSKELKKHESTFIMKCTFVFIKGSGCPYSTKQ